MPLLHWHVKASIPFFWRQMCFQGGSQVFWISSSALRSFGKSCSWISIFVLTDDGFARYHVGESMLASMRHFLRFIDLDSAFDSYGFVKKVSFCIPQIV